MNDWPKASPPPTRGGDRRTWLIAGAGAAAAAAAVLWLFSRAPAPLPPAAAPKPAPVVGLTQLNDATDAVVREQAILLDPTPLFLPTQWNAQPHRQPAGAMRGTPEAAFIAFEPKLLFDKNALGLKFPAAVATPGRPVDVLALGTLPRPLLGLGRVDFEAAPLEERSGLIEVAAAGTGDLVLAQVLTGASPPAGDWAPPEFLVVANATGLVGPPELVRSSGRDAVDAYFRTFLEEKFRLGTRLRPGSFRVCIGP
jgi:hypothetical protein